MPPHEDALTLAEWRKSSFSGGGGTGGGDCVEAGWMMGGSPCATATTPRRARSYSPEPRWKPGSRASGRASSTTSRNLQQPSGPSGRYGGLLIPLVGYRTQQREAA